MAARHQRALSRRREWTPPGPLHEQWANLLDRCARGIARNLFSRDSGHLWTRFQAGHDSITREWKKPAAYRLPSLWRLVWMELCGNDCPWSAKLAASKTVLVGENIPISNARLWRKARARSH